MPRDRSYRRNAGIALLLLAPLTSLAQQAPAGGANADELAKQLSNPVAALISVPLQLNYDDGYGVGGDGDRFTLNIQPVVPISLNNDWNVISRTILPLIAQDDVVGDGSESGHGRHPAEPVLLAQDSRLRAAGSWAPGPRSCCRRRATTYSAPSSGRSDRRSSR